MLTKLLIIFFLQDYGFLRIRQYNCKPCNVGFPARLAIFLMLEGLFFVLILHLQQMPWEEYYELAELARLDA